MDANWSRTGAAWCSPPAIVLKRGFRLKERYSSFDLATHQVTTLPGSEDMSSPRWSPDGRFIAVESLVGSKGPESL